MVAKRTLLAGVLCLLLCGMRDPFQPPADSCQLAELKRWRFHGIVANGHTTGILKDGDGRWHRLAVGERLATGWRILAINSQEIVIATGEACNPAQWRWQREGTQNDKMDSHPHAVMGVGRRGANVTAGHTDAG